MGKKLYVGNLPFSASEHALADVFAEFGNVESAKIITDRDTGRSKGFAFVEFSTDQEALAAIDSLNGREWEGRAMTVNEAKPQAPRRDNNRGGGFSGSRGGSRW